MTTNKRIHNATAAGAGVLPDIENPGQVIGACPSCGAEIAETHVLHPHTNKVERALLHAIPFCSYFGATDAMDIELDIKAGTKR